MQYFLIGTDSDVLIWLLAHYFCPLEGFFYIPLCPLMSHPYSSLNPFSNRNNGIPFQNIEITMKFDNLRSELNDKERKLENAR